MLIKTAVCEDAPCRTCGRFHSMAVDCSVVTAAEVLPVQPDSDESINTKIPNATTFGTKGANYEK